MQLYRMSGYDTVWQEADVERPEHQPGTSDLCLPQYYIPRHQLERYLGDEYKVNNVQIPDVESVSPDMQQKMSNLLKPDFPMWLEWDNLSYQIEIPVKKRKFWKAKTQTRQILDGVTAKARPGEFMAVMGPTGSGKTTILGILAGRIQTRVTGKILMNGKPISTDRNYKRRVAYILQDDVFLANLTVLQTLVYTALLRLPDSLTTKQKIQKVYAIIDILNLQKATNTIMGGPFKRGVSGGERKRANIANELLSNPSLVLLDEPTSGLDTSTAINLIKFLKVLAECGMTVISSIHQPSAEMFALFDKLLLLVDGRPAFYGKADDALHYFFALGIQPPITTNPADYVMSILIHEELMGQDKVKQQLFLAYRERESVLLETLGETPSNPDWQINVQYGYQLQMEAMRRLGRRFKFPIPFSKQFYILLQRSFFQARGGYLTPSLIFQVVFVAVIVGLFWLRIPNSLNRVGDTVGVLFFIGIFSGGFFPLFNAVSNFPPERAVLIRERSSGAYNLSAFYLSRLTAEIPFEVFFPLVFIGISYYMVGLNENFGRCVRFFLIVLVTAYASSGLGLMISARVTNYRVAIVTASAAMITMVLMGGFYIPVEHVRAWIRWLQYLSFINYAFDGMLINEFSGETFSTQDGGSVSGESILDTMITANIVTNSFWANWFVVLGFALLFRTAAFYLLKYTYKLRT